MIPKAKFLATLLSSTLLLLGARAAESHAISGDHPLVQHAIDARIDPVSGTIDGSDRLTLPDGMVRVELHLHEGLQPRVIEGKAALDRIGRDGHLEHFLLTTDGNAPVTIHYGGPIRHSLTRVTEGMGRARQQTIGTIDADGVFLNGYTGWYPRIADTLAHFTLDLTLPRGWLAVSQGQGPDIEEDDDARRVRWREDRPQHEIQLAAAPFRLYRRDTPVAEAQAFLRLSDDALAARYLDATSDYLTRYSDLIGPYPYAKFALVENFWETGYGMPSFTLLGSRVLRLPFILNSSYPHEILHNWWGNGVFVDYTAGNWSEGLTAYLADHLNQALLGRGAEYRRDQLKAYADYVRDGGDFPLTHFRGRHGSASQAIGYGKALMVFHMLRIRLGDTTFVRGLRRFYDDNLFETADWGDVENAFEIASGHKLDDFFDAWTTRTGSPTLHLTSLRDERLPNGAWRVRGSVLQSRSGAPFPMTVPVVIHDRRGKVRELRVDLAGRSTAFEAMLPAPPVRVAVDPRFDTFRTLLAGESPVSLSSLLGADSGLIVLPAAAEGAAADGWRGLARAWLQGQPGWQVRTDTDLSGLPADRPVWLLGWDNRFLSELVEVGNGSGHFALDATRRAVTLEDETHDAVSPVLTAERNGQALGWIAAATPEAIAGLARKLPHYGKYSYLLFTGEAPDNLLKGLWPPGDSPLVQWLVEDRPALTLPEPPALVRR